MEIETSADGNSDILDNGMDVLDPESGNRIDFIHEGIENTLECCDVNTECNMAENDADIEEIMEADSESDMVIHSPLNVPIGPGIILHLS